MRAAAACFLTLAAGLVALPIALRPATPSAAAATTLTIIGSQDENTRGEFARAFATWARRERGVDVAIAWLSPGGSADVQRLLRARYRAALQGAHPDLSAAELDGALDPRDTGAGRAALLGESLGVGIDCCWGGSAPLFRAAAAAGFLVDAGLVEEHPEWFGDDAIPAALGGEALRDEHGRWYAACLSGMGIAWNPQRLAAMADPRPPLAWADLAQPRWRQRLAIADPGRSAAAVAAFERLIQQQMAEAADGGADEARARELGWDRGFALIRGIVANARAIEDGASKPPRAVARGEAVAAICLDFQARGEAEYATTMSGDERRLVSAAPRGGAGVAPEPIALLRGAPQRELALDFIRFVLSPAGQRLWDYRVGEPGGPTQYALRRAAVRRDVYQASDRARMSDPELDPFAVAAASAWRGERTAAVVALIAPLTRSLALDALPELRAAWDAIADAGGPTRVPAAMREFAWSPVAYGEAPAALAALGAGAASALPLQRAWCEQAIAHYRRAAALAASGR